MKIELCSVPANFGHGANDGAYYPVGLLTLGTHLRQVSPHLSVSVVDLHHDRDFKPSADIVGISCASTLNYQNVLALAGRAKEYGAIVILGGPHATQLADQILHNRSEVVDYVIRGNGEGALASLLEALQNGLGLSNVPSLSWRSPEQGIVHNAPLSSLWKYDDFLPLDLTLLRSGLKPYFDTFKARIDPEIDAAFVVFTHFGCGYREMMQHRAATSKQLSRWCSYCSLNDPLLTRSGDAIVAEVLDLLNCSRVATNSNVLLKCYGDNVGTQPVMLDSLASAIERCDGWNQYRIGWTFYSQSSRLTPELMRLLSRVGTKNLYIGFDSVDDRVQLLNGLGTSAATHQRASSLCQERGIKIQAGFVLGSAGETEQSVNKTLRFAEKLASQGALERINSAVLFITPGSPAYSLLCEREPWINALDELPTEELQWNWIRHFCPELGNSPSDGIAILKRAANLLDELLSSAPHASMGFISDRLASEDVLARSIG